MPRVARSRCASQALTGCLSGLRLVRSLTSRTQRMTSVDARTTPPAALRTAVAPIARAKGPSFSLLAHRQGGPAPADDRAVRSGRARHARDVDLPDPPRGGPGMSVV